MCLRDLLDRWQAHAEVAMVAVGDGHGANVDRVDRVGKWVDVDPACPIGGESERAKVKALPSGRPPEVREDSI